MLGQLFNLFALIYVFRSLQLTAVIWRERADLKQPPLTPRKKHLGEQAAFFIAVPIGVFFHELGHALSVWQFDGQVLQFAYRGFWGFVEHIGNYTAPERWFISLAGTIGSLLFGLALWLIFRNNNSPALRYFGLRAFRFQTYFSLIYYPVFTLLGFEGDWRAIYNFSATPIASSVTAVLHAALLFLFWQGDRTGWFETPAHPTAAAAAEFAQLTRAAQTSPHDPELQMSYIDALRRGGAANAAKRQLRAFIQKNPHSGLAYLQLALAQAGQKQQIPRPAVQNLRKSLQLGLPTPQAQTVAHQLLGRYALDIGKIEDVIHHFSQAISFAHPPTPSLYHDRSLAYRRQKQYDLAYQDLIQALQLAQKNQPQQVEFYRNELETLSRQSGRTWDIPPALPTQEGGDSIGIS